MWDRDESVVDHDENDDDRVRDDASSSSSSTSVQNPDESGDGDDSFLEDPGKMRMTDEEDVVDAVHDGDGSDAWIDWQNWGLSHH